MNRYRGAQAVGAGAVVLAVAVLYAIATVAFGAVSGAVVAVLLGLVVGALVLTVCVLLGRGLAIVIGWWGRSIGAALLGSALALALLLRFLLSWPDALLPWLVAGVLVAPLLIGGGLVLAIRPPHHGVRTAGVVAGVAGGGLLAWSLLWLGSSGSDPFPRAPARQRSTPTELLARDPSAPGPYQVRSLTYGSGSDERRPEYGAGVDFTSSAVSLSAVLPEWAGFRATHREWWWGFDLDAAPVNGRLYLPIVEPGDARPLAVMAHGNHRMTDFSDAGYEYLGRLLASHGIAAVSVDANFLNGAWSGDFGGREMPARAILMLEHLRQFRRWTRDPRSLLYRRIDLDRVALVGHSRGGEAAAIATAFNRLEAFPDDASLRFDYGFGIEAVVAIAQIDRRYSRRIELEDVSFLAIQGSYDTDEPSFHGLRQFYRTSFPAAGDGASQPFRFKAGVVAHRANHGQFNSTWGMDSGFPGSLWLNRAPLLAEADQRKVAEVYVGAFLRATLLGELGMLPLFRNYRAGAAYLPETRYVSQYRDSATEVLAGFEEDLDLTTPTVAGSISARGFARWREEEMHFRDGSKQGTSALRLEIGGTAGTAPVWEMRLDEPVPLSRSDQVTLDVVWDPAEDSPDRPLLSMSLQLLLEGGDGPEVDVADVLSPEPPFEVRFLKSARMDRERYRSATEDIPQTILIPGDLLLPQALAPAPGEADREGAALDGSAAVPEAPARLVGVRLRFEPLVGGRFVLAELGIRRAPPAPGDASQDPAGG